MPNSRQQYFGRYSTAFGLVGCLVLRSGSAAEATGRSVELELIGQAADSGPLRATRSTLRGDWVGIADARDVVMMLRVSLNLDGAVLAVATLDGEVANTHVFRIDRFGIEDGRFVAGTNTSVVQLDLNMKRAYQTGWGEGWVVERLLGQAERRMRVQFFYNVGRGAASQLVQTENGVWVPPATLVGKTAWLPELTRILTTAQRQGTTCLDIAREKTK